MSRWLKCGCLESAAHSRWCSRIDPLPADTSPSRTSNAVSANDAAYLLLKLRERLQEVPTETYGSIGMPDSVRDFRDSMIDHIDDLLDEHGTAKERSSDWMRSQSLDAPTNTNPPRSYESQASRDAHGTASHVAPASPSIPSGGVSEGLNIGSEPSVPNAPNAVPMSETAIRAVIYDCTDAQCVCGRCGPIKIAVDCSIERVLR